MKQRKEVEKLESNELILLRVLKELCCDGKPKTDEVLYYQMMIRFKEEINKTFKNQNKATVKAYRLKEGMLTIKKFFNINDLE